MKRKVEQAVRDCAASEVSWRSLRKHGLKSYTEVLAAMADLGLHPYMAPLTGPNVEQRLAAMQILRDKITQGREEET